MRFLHTADWHIGKNLNEYSLLTEQAFMCQQIITLMASDTYDCLVIAGDLYDRSQPSKKALELVNETFEVIINQLKKPIILIAGNHDSTILIDYGSKLLAKSALYTYGETTITPASLTLNDTTFHLLPFISPFQANQLYQQDFPDFNSLLTYQLTLIKFNPNTYNVLIAHAYVISGNEIPLLDESMRPISLGTAQYVNSDLFKAFDYVALGHIHRAQPIGSPKIRYAGALYKYSKTEANYQISVSDVSLTSAGLKVELIPLALSKDVNILRNSLAQLLQKNSDDYVYLELTDTFYQIDVSNQLRKHYPNLLGIEYINLKTTSEIITDETNLKTLTPLEQFESFFTTFTEKELSPAQKIIIEQTFKELTDETQ